MAKKIIITTEGKEFRNFVLLALGVLYLVSWIGVRVLPVTALMLAAYLFVRNLFDFPVITIFIAGISLLALLIFKDQLVVSLFAIAALILLRLRSA